MRMAESLAMALDPVHMAARAGYSDLDPWQARVLRERAQQTILLTTRQGGKSTVTALLSAEEAVFYPPALVLLFAPTTRQSKLLYDQVRRIIHQLGETTADYVKDTESELVLTNASRVVCLPGSEGTVRGYSGVSLLVIDEAARCPDLLYEAVRPMLAVSQGRIVLLSTGWGRRGFFFETWTNGGPDWHRVKITAEQCPRIAPGWLARERSITPERMFRQEFMCSFEDVDAQVFPTDLVLGAFSEAVAPIFPGGVR
jgi:terminase large subunit-like protein